MLLSSSKERAIGAIRCAVASTTAAHSLSCFVRKQPENLWISADGHVKITNQCFARSFFFFDLLVLSFGLLMRFALFFLFLFLCAPADFCFAKVVEDRT